MTTITHLECSLCGKRREAGQVHNLCECGGPLLVRYDLDKVRASWNREWIPNGPSSMWRYAPVLPVSKPAAMTTLGEGMTPLIETRRLGKRLGARDLWVKDEGVNPTGSFKARGLSCAISMCVELGLTKVAIPSAGNAAGAMAAYAAAAGIEAHIFMPRDVPQSNYIECCAAGAKVTLENVKTGGDIDNRIKVLFDALRMPKIGEFDAETPPAPDEAPFFCLLQDDSLITEIKVTTDRLLTPLQTEEDSDDVHLVIHVRTILIAGNAFPDGGAGNFYAT
jgi:threonine synthase